MNARKDRPLLRLLVGRAACSVALACSMLPQGWGVSPEGGAGSVAPDVARALLKQMDRPNPKDLARIKERVAWQRRQQSRGEVGLAAAPSMMPRRQEGVDKVLVILAEFGGTNTFSWTPGSSTWDPLGRCDSAEFDGSNVGNRAASLFFARHHGIGGATNFTYRGPLHNELPRPLGSGDPSAWTVWVPDFSADHYSNIVFGHGIVFDYQRQDGSAVREDFTGASVRGYYEELSRGAYSIRGNVLGWVKVPHSAWWYGADALPGSRSGALGAANAGAVPGAGSARSFVIDALDSARASYPGFDWASFDQDGDGEIDRLWIIHAGYGEEDQPALLNRTGAGESALWSHSSALGNPHEIVPGVRANSYIMMPENAGIAVLAHEFAHNLGAIDLYTYGEGQTSAGFWTLMADSWVGFPLGFLPQAMDPMHLDQWGWLEPLTISDPARVQVATLGQAIGSTGGGNPVRAVKIVLPENRVPLAVRPRGTAQWWGGQELLAAGAMTLRQPVRLPAAGGALEVTAAYDTEPDRDFLIIEVSADGEEWDTLARWSGVSAGYPDYSTNRLSLAGYAGQEVRFRFRYTTDESLLGSGPFVDEVAVRSGETTWFLSRAGADGDAWAYAWPWRRSLGEESYPHCLYLQWRNTGGSGGYDRALGDPRFRFGPVDPGLVVWYHDERYFENTIAEHLGDAPSFGPKGRLLVVDAHPEPYRDPHWTARGIEDETGNVFSRALMRDAAFSRLPGAGFGLQPPFVVEPARFEGSPPLPWFSMALGYYPGIEPQPRGIWRTRQWDASVVLPSRVQYPVRGPGYPLGGALERVVASRTFQGTTELLTYRTNAVAGGIRLAGGDGHPGSVGGDYGWNAWIVEQGEASARVVVWNNLSAQLDDDSDGSPNWSEAIAGTDPKEVSSVLQMVRITPVDGGGARLEWTSAANRIYRVWRATAPGAGPAVEIGSRLPATPPRNTFVDAHPPGLAAAFYRVEIQ